VSTISDISDQLRGFSSEAWHCLYFSSAHQWDYWMQHLLPEVSLAPSARVDAALLAAAEKALGIDFSAPDAEVARRRLRLPVRLRGGGVRSHVETTRAAFVGMMVKNLPHMIDSVEGSGRVVRGFFHSQLVLHLGAGSFDPGSIAPFASFVGGGGASARAFEASWDWLVRQVGSSVEEGPLIEPVQSASGTQKELTREVESVWFRRLSEDVRLLPRRDFQRICFCSVDSQAGMWCYAIPTASFRPHEGEFREIAATYFGMPSPVASALDGQVIWSKRGTERGVCDKYGEKLVSLQLSGDGWNTAHDFFKFALCEVMRDLKVGFSCEVFGLFSSLIPQGPHRAPLDADTVRAARMRQGMVPDFKVESASLSHRFGGIRASSSTLAELKFIHLGATRYPRVVTADGRRCYAVAKRASRVGPEMEASARRLDTEFGGQQAGTDGPVLRRLRSFGPVLPLVVGHFGEWNEGLSDLVKAVADDAAPRMASLFGAASQRAARSSILFFAKRSLSWAGLLANARLKLERSVFVGPTWAAAARRREEGARADDQSRARCREGAEHHRGWARSHAPAQRSQAGVSGG
jgi:hypothetical protein